MFTCMPSMSMWCQSRHWLPIHVILVVGSACAEHEDCMLSLTVSWTWGWGIAAVLYSQTRMGGILFGLEGHRLVLS